VGKKIVILGGGVGGVAAARALTAELSKHGVDAEVTLVTKEEKHYMPPLFFDVAMGEAAPHETYAPITALEQRYGVKVVVDPAEKIDAANRVVVTKGGAKLDYDYLIVALGTTQEWGKYPGLAEEGYHNYTLEGAIEFRKALSQFKGGDLVILRVPLQVWNLPVRASHRAGSELQERRDQGQH